MIKLRLKTFKSPQGETDIPLVEGEKLEQAIKRSVEGVELGDRSPEEIFQVLVNGYHIEKDFWATVVLKNGDNVLIAPKIQDDFGTILKSAVLLVVTAVVSAYFPPAAYGLYSALYVAGAAIATSLVLNALIPPPVPELGGANGGGTVEQSQMYSVSGQSNNVKRYGFVPKVYGSHRIFPNLAANPYTDIEVDRVTKELVQYLYVVYDFGLGPVVLRDILIGDTPITSFSDVSYHIIDTKKPLVAEGPWDNGTESELVNYKGDSTTEAVSATLDGNRAAGDVLGSYQAQRNAALNPSNYEQEITLTLLNPQGLYAYDAQGNLRDRTIELEIDFAPVGTEDWRPFNDRSAVKSFSALGGDEAYNPTTADLLPLEIVPGVLFNHLGVYSLIDAGPTGIKSVDDYRGVVALTKEEIAARWPSWGRDVRYGYPAGSTTLILRNNLALQPLTSLVYNNDTIGQILSVTNYGFVFGYSVVTLQQPLLNDLVLFTYRESQPAPAHYLINPPAYPYFPIDFVTTGKVFIGLGIVGKARITRDSTVPCYSIFKFVPKSNGEYKVRISRVSTISAANFQVSDTLAWTAITTRFNVLPINTDKRHTLLELKIRATNQLNGVVQNLSAVVDSVLDVYNGSVWEKQVTNNPAWVYVDLLTGQVNKRAISKSRLHLPSIIEWANFCDQVPVSPPNTDTFFFPRFECNFVLDYPATLQEVLTQVSSSAQAGLNIIDGKYGVLIDKLRTVPVQIFTPRNSTNFSSSRNYAAKPHALKIRYVEPSIGWDTTETIVYDDGYDFNNAIEFDELLCFGCTNWEQAWRFGRYMIAQNRLRQETISIDVDFEHLVCTRGDFVQVTQDAMKVGGSPARVKSITGNQVVIDDGLELSNLINYGYVFRGIDGQIKSNTLTFLNSDTFLLDGSVPADMPQVGDLIIIGEVTRVVYDCIVKSITPGDDLKASLVLVEKADAIYSAESSNSIPDYDAQLSQTVNPEFYAPEIVRNLAIADTAYQCNASGQGYDYYVDLVWDNPLGSAFELFEIYVDDGRGLTNVGTTRSNVYRHIVDQTRLNKEHKFTVLAVSASGKKLDLINGPIVTSTPLKKITPPSNVESLASNITGEVIQLSWDKIDDCDCQEYQIRFSPDTAIASWENSVPLLRVDRNVTLASTQARSGAYLIKAVDFAGNQSSAPAFAITTIPELFNLNIIDETNDFPTLPGTLELTEKVGNALTLQKLTVGPDTYYSEGYYYYENFLDLGEIYTVRLQSLIQAEGITNEDLMSSWLTLADVAALANAGSSDWDVKAEYRATNTFNVIADWLSLDVIDPISEGNQDNFTPWRDFIMGDATGRIFQFRLKLLSYRSTVTPRVFDGTIRADMPDRFESFQNLSAPSSGYELIYAPAFKGPGTTPNIQISIDGASSGDYWSFDYRSLTGFKVRFFDSSNNPVARTFDVSIKGFGREALNII